MPYRVKGISDDKTYWLSSKGNWISDERHAGEFREDLAHILLKSTNDRNCTLDAEDRIEPEIVGP
jgi:hypothetical protein